MKIKLHEMLSISQQIIDTENELHEIKELLYDLRSVVKDQELLLRIESFLELCQDGHLKEDNNIIDFR